MSEPPRPRVVTFFSVDDALEAGDEDDLAVVHGLLDARRVDVEDARLHVHRVGDDAGLRAGEAHGVVAEAVDRHGEQGAADALAGGEEHVHLALGRVGGDLAGELEELVGGVATGAHDRADAVALLERGDDAPRHVADAGGVGDRRATVLLDDDRQGEPPKKTANESTRPRLCGALRRPRGRPPPQAPGLGAMRGSARLCSLAACMASTLALTAGDASDVSK